MTQPTDTPAFGKLFIDVDGDLCIEGRNWTLVAREAKDFAVETELGDWVSPNADVFPEIIRRWNLVGEADAAEGGALMALATVTGERDAARAEVERLLGKVEAFSEYEGDALNDLEAMTAERDAALADYAAESDQHDATAAALKVAEAERDAALARVAELEAQLADVLAREAETHRRHDERVENMEAKISIWKQNSCHTWQAMCAMRNAINEWIAMPSIESDLLQGPETSVFCKAVADAVISYVRREECSAQNEPATGADTTGPRGSAANAQGAEGSATSPDAALARVKELEARQPKALQWDNFGLEMWADGVAGRYYISGHGGKWSWSFDDSDAYHHGETVASEAAALAAANAHNAEVISAWFRSESTEKPSGESK